MGPILWHVNCARHAMLTAATEAGWVVRAWKSGTAPRNRMDAAVVLAGADADLDALRPQFPHALFVSTGPRASGFDVGIPAHVDTGMAQNVLDLARTWWRRSLERVRVLKDLSVARKQIHQLADIGAALSSEREPGRLLGTILTEARRIAECDAGSLYLVDDGVDEPALVFKLAQNDSIQVPFAEQRLALTGDSLAGYVALTGDELNLDDVYEVDESAPYRFNRSFDAYMGYRTRSVLVLPMRDHRDRVVGVLQFINRKAASGSVVAFDGPTVELMRAVASQAAVAIQKNALISDINRLFEQFVHASVKAIERRDPTTSGHSFRVAETTTALLETLPASGLARFRGLSLPAEHVREVRYAALLHDFGKVGVREQVLTKANKLSDDRLEIIRYRFELEKERLRRRALERQLELLHAKDVDIEVTLRRVHRELEAKLGLLDDYYTAITLANNPNVLAEGQFEHLDVIRDHPFVEIDGRPGGLITGTDLSALSVRRGSLTPEERREIESHVVHTREFLSALPWPPELGRVPEIAGAHHEKLDGSGYPDGLAGDEIPLASRVMTVCDIFDALTAMDRPYKAALPVERALAILEDEVSRGLLDADVVSVFIGHRTYSVLDSPAAGAANRA